MISKMRSSSVRHPLP
uniref:Uncharacterized protein n=1 Tax=Anguilla anguilla TaxID=7936 RepID=A0A0E9TGI4_ANGAN